MEGDDDMVEHVSRAVEGVELGRQSTRPSFEGQEEEEEEEGVKEEGQWRRSRTGRKTKRRWKD
jgi:hypothetical protein